MQLVYRGLLNGFQKVEQPRHLCRKHRFCCVIDHTALRAANGHDPHGLVYCQPKLLLRQKLIFQAEKIQISAALDVSAKQNNSFQQVLYFGRLCTLTLFQQLTDPGYLRSVLCFQFVINPVFFGQLIQLFLYEIGFLQFLFIASYFGLVFA